MKSRNILFGIFILLAMAMNAQQGKDVVVETKSAVTKLNVETDNLNELVDFDWKIANDMFKSNDENQEIALAFSYTNKAENKSNPRIENLKFKITGETKELNSLINQSKKMIERFAILHQKYEDK